MNPQFRIESIETKRRGTYVRATIVTAQNFAVSAGDTLGGVRLSSDKFSEPRQGTFVFKLETASDADRLTIDAIVSLCPLDQ